MRATGGESEGGFADDAVMSTTEMRDLFDARNTLDVAAGQLVRPVALVDARMGTTAAPAKALLPILGRPLLWYVVQRLRTSALLRDVVVLTTDSGRDAPIRSYCRRQAIEVFAASEHDATDRAYRAALRYGANPVVLVRGEAAFVDPTVVDRLLLLLEEGQFDFATVATGAPGSFLEGARFPAGVEAQALSLHALERTWAEATEPSDRAEVTSYVARAPGRFAAGTLHAERAVPDLRLTIASEADLDLARRVYASLGGADRAFTLEEVLEFLDRKPELLGLARRHGAAEAYQLAAA
jgi:spore coat polysaccharide biosynthesis protein SpsF